MDTYRMHQNYWFVGQHPNETYYLSNTPTEPNINAPEDALATHPDGTITPLRDNDRSDMCVDNQAKTPYALLYHVTMDEYLETILSEGLHPKIGALSAQLGETDAHVYLFPNESTMSDALAKWMGEAYEEIAESRGIELEELVLHSLEVRIPLDKWQQTLTPSAVGYEAISTQCIPAEWIAYHSEQ